MDCICKTSNLFLFSCIPPRSYWRPTLLTPVVRFHCHNLIHEDHNMLAAFNVSGFAELVELGYNDTIFLNPLEPMFAPEANTPEKFTEAAILDKINFLANMRPYADIGEREEDLAAYYAANPGANFEDFQNAKERRSTV